MRGEVHILVYCPIDTLQWGSTHSAFIDFLKVKALARMVGGPQSALKCPCDRREGGSIAIWAMAK